MSFCLDGFSLRVGSEYFFFLFSFIFPSRIIRVRSILAQIGNSARVQTNQCSLHKRSKFNAYLYIALWNEIKNRIFACGHSEKCRGTKNCNFGLNEKCFHSIHSFPSMKIIQGQTAHKRRRCTERNIYNKKWDRKQCKKKLFGSEYEN